jgi:hypothetical protein
MTLAHTTRHLALAAGLAALLTGCATTVPPAPVASAELMQRLDGLLRQAAPAARVGLRISPETVTTGQLVTADVQSAQGGYLYLLQLGTDGQQLSLVFPNAADGANLIPAGGRLQLPRPGWRMRTAGPAGVGYLMAVVTAEPQDLTALGAAVQRQAPAFQGLYGAALQPLKEVAP